MPQKSRSAKRERQYARHGESEQARGSSINDMSASRRGGLRSHQGAGGRTLAQLRNEALSGYSRLDVWAA